MSGRRHWAWATLASFVVAYAVGIVWAWLSVRGLLSDQREAPLEWVYRECYLSARNIAPWLASGFVEVWHDLPFFVAALVTYELLRRPAQPGPLRCLECDQILKGLTEPRCPGCGERI
jgi:hypothetical protein